MKAADEEVRIEKVRLDFIPNVSKFIETETNEGTR